MRLFHYAAEARTGAVTSLRDACQVTEELTGVWECVDSGACDCAAMTNLDVAISSTEAVIDWDGLKTWYRIVGDLDVSSGHAPVVIVHGGPGATHDYLEPLTGLVRGGRACIFYDQVGCGRSTHDRQAPKTFWTVDLFLMELVTLYSAAALAPVLDTI